MIIAVLLAAGESKRMGRPKALLPIDGMRFIEKIVIDISVPPDFPEKYHTALVKVVDQCSVKKFIMNPPKFEIKTTVKE